MCSNPNDLVGKIYYTRFPYYDVKNKKQSYKARPVLIVGAEKDSLPCDFTVLPISKISNSNYIHDVFDYKLENEKIQTLGLKFDPSYIRIHKQSYTSSIDVQKNPISSLRELYPEIYEGVKDLSKQFHDTLFNL